MENKKSKDRAFKEGSERRTFSSIFEEELNGFEVSNNENKNEEEGSKKKGQEKKTSRKMN